MKVTYVSVGKDVLGRSALLHPVAANWWRLFVQIVRRDLGVELEIIQAKGTYSGSANTHADGWAIDLRTYKFTNAKVLAIVALARRYGASATWYRTTVGSGPHIHLVVDAGSTRTASSYQTAAVRAGYNGLGAGGRGGRDPHPKPPAWRTAAAGIAAMTTSLTPTTTGGLTMSDINTIVTKLDYTQAQLKAIAEGTMGRAAINARNADVATIVKAATDAQSRVLLDAMGKTGGLSTTDLNALKTEMRAAVADALDGAVLEIKAGA